MKILVTGASGFIGSYIVEEALRQGMETWAAVRPSSSRKYLQDERIHFINLNLSSKEELISQLDGQEFDYVVHAAGATKCLHAEDFYRVNTEGTKNLVGALIALKMPIKRFVFVSSLSIFGAIREEQPYQEITEHDTPHPNTAYGKSKWEAEKYLDSLGIQFPYIILRPTGVYGPRDGRKYFLSDGGIYQSTAFSDLIRKELDNPWMLRIKAPIWVLRIVTFFGEYIGRITGKMSALNNDKYNILKQRNWRCDIEPAMDELGYHPHYPLERGVKLAIKWYKENHWL